MTIKIRDFNYETHNHNFKEREQLRPYIGKTGRFEGILTEIQYRINADRKRYRIGIFTTITSPTWSTLELTHLQLIIPSQYRSLKLFHCYSFIGTINSYYLPKQITMQDGTKSLVSTCTYGVKNIKHLEIFDHQRFPNKLSRHQFNEINRIDRCHPDSNYNAKTLRRYLLQLPDNGAREAMLNHYRNHLRSENQTHLTDLLRLKQHHKSLYY